MKRWPPIHAIAARDGAALTAGFSLSALGAWSNWAFALTLLGGGKCDRLDGCISVWPRGFAWPGRVYWSRTRALQA